MEFDLEALVYLDKHGFVPGREAAVAAQGPDGTLVLEVGAGTVVLGASLAGQLYVATLTPAEGHIAHMGQTRYV